MFKKSLVAGALLASLIGAANAEWAVVSQEDNSVVMADQAVGVSLVIAEVDASSDAPVAEVAKASSQNMGCNEASTLNLGGYDGYYFECPASNQFVFLFDAEGTTNMFTGVCDSDDKCKYVGEQIGRVILAAKGQ